MKAKIDHGDWMSAAGSRRRTNGVATDDGDASGAIGSLEARDGYSSDPTGWRAIFPTGWIEAIRGMLFFGVLATVLWLEWVAIKAIVVYVASWL